MVIYLRLRLTSDSVTIPMPFQFLTFLLRFILSPFTVRITLHVPPLPSFLLFFYLFLSLPHLLSFSLSSLYSSTRSSHPFTFYSFLSVIPSPTQSLSHSPPYSVFFIFLFLPLTLSFFHPYSVSFLSVCFRSEAVRKLFRRNQNTQINV